VTRLLVCGSLVLVALVAASPAQAQIYSWRDATGSLVLSEHPPSDPTTETNIFPVRNAESAILTTRPIQTLSYRDSYDSLIVQHAQAQGVRADLVRAVVQVESGYNPRAISPVGAMGLMQLMPTTAASLGVKRPLDPVESIRGGTLYLRQLLDRFDGNEELALAAYNAGPEAVGRYGNQVPPYRETREYVRKVKTQTSVTNVSAPATPPIYKTIQVIDGRAVPFYSNTKPAEGSFEVIVPVK
jgi:soluble lytic murein transglycosylase-like protein